MHYRVVEPADADAARVLMDVMSWLAGDQEMQRDRERLIKVCCAPQLPVKIQVVGEELDLVAEQLVLIGGYLQTEVRQRRAGEQRRAGDRERELRPLDDAEHAADDSSLERSHVCGGERNGS